MIREVAPSELATWRQDEAREPPLLVDVREPWEFEYCHIEDSMLVPLAALPSATGRLPRDRDIVVVCHHGVRSFHAAVWLASAGFPRVQHLRGGIAAWANEVDTTMKRY